MGDRWKCGCGRRYKFLENMELILHFLKVAAAVLEWATDRGASVYCHWFQPLAAAGLRHGQSAQVQMSMVEFDRKGKPVWDFKVSSVRICVFGCYNTNTSRLFTSGKKYSAWRDRRFILSEWWTSCYSPSGRVFDCRPNIANLFTRRYNFYPCLLRGIYRSSSW